DQALALAASTLGDPGPLLHQELAALAVGLEIDGSDDLVADQHRQREVAELALHLRHIGLEQVVVAEEQHEPRALMDERVEWRQEVDALADGPERRLQELGPREVLLLARAFERDRQELTAAHAGLDQLAHGRLARGVEVAGRIDADDALRTQRPLEPIVDEL